MISLILFLIFICFYIVTFIFYVIYNVHSCKKMFFIKIVGIGLRSVFTLMRESRTIDPVLCTKALSALLDVLQGQLPEGLKSEPDDVIGLCL